MKLTGFRGAFAVLPLSFGLEIVMAVPKKDDFRARAFAGPVLWILLLLASYWLIADWQEVPQLIASTIGMMQ